jgi:hypothetical protein
MNPINPSIKRGEHTAAMPTQEKIYKKFSTTLFYD